MTTKPAVAAEVPTTTGDGHWHVKVSLPASILWGDRHDEDNVPVCVMRHADYDLRTDGNVPVMRFMTRLSGVTDFEHDPSRFGLVEVAIPHTLYDAYDRRTIVGVITDLRIYPAGVDPLTQSNGDTQAGWCEPEKSGYGPGHKRHRFAPYIPPTRPETQRLVGRAALVELEPEKRKR